MVDTLKYSIIKTLVFFDIYDHPLTSEELFNFLLLEDSDFLGEKEIEKINKISFADFIEKIEKYKNLDEINFKEGYWFLQGKEKSIMNRKNKYKILNRKMLIAKKAVKKITFIPFLRAVFVCNTLPYGIVDDSSDIDVFIIIKKNRLWITRFLITIILSFWNLRRTNKKIKDKICLSFYVTDNVLNLNSIKISGLDIYLIYWLKNLTPIYDPDNLVISIKKANIWLDRYIKKTNYFFSTSNLWKVDNISYLKIRKFLNKICNKIIFDIIEKIFRFFQKIKMQEKNKDRYNKKAVIINDNMLKFHENDRRKYYQEKWLEKCKKLGVKI